MRQRSGRLAISIALALAAALFMAACGGPTRPSRNPGGGNNGGGNQQPPPNNPPVIDSITIQGTRAKEPASFADVAETVAITAKVHDDETAVDQLQYEWTAPVGTFSGTGASVTWQAPATATTPGDVTITLKVLEKYGFPGGPQAFQHDVTGTAKLSLHDSVKEVGDMARQFLLDFSDTNIKDANYIMRNFAEPSKCPEPNEVTDEREQITTHFRYFVMQNFRIGPAAVTVAFGGRCPVDGRRGDACALVPSFWDSIDLRDNARRSVDGTDIVAAIYSPVDVRWWLCASNYDGHLVQGVGPSFYIR
ncbi:MAG: hypothetical protein DMF84_27470 [Acidobacteria bacterium]|nr:MAG: hypothetical protein DMF84_27470 [Acidobacteriota bacterium]